ncbi:MAG: hypothetical protein LBU11_08350 [Zoogloeaceae bacterium]|jgi:hypothetical protein|nr:hypothetical protein [Zoogloeaceae bacterium]
MIIETSRAGFCYRLEHFAANGERLHRLRSQNLMPEVGMNYVVGAAFGGQSPASAWYIGLFSGGYTPYPPDTMASFPLNAQEFTQYAGNTRVPFTPRPPEAGGIDNAANRAEFVFTGDGEIKGGFIASSSGKGATSGILVSAVRFSSPILVHPEETLRVLAGFALVST